MRCPLYSIIRRLEEAVLYIHKLKMHESKLDSTICLLTSIKSNVFQTVCFHSVLIYFKSTSYQIFITNKTIVMCHNSSAFLQKLVGSQ